MKKLTVDQILVGEALVGEGKEVAHIELIMRNGPRFLDRSLTAFPG